MNQITTRYVTENGACYEQYVITDAEAKTELVITPERGGMITGFSLNGEEYIWTRHPNFAECNRPRFGVPVLYTKKTINILVDGRYQQPSLHTHLLLAQPTLHLWYLCYT